MSLRHRITGALAVLCLNMGTASAFELDDAPVWPIVTPPPAAAEMPVCAPDMPLPAARWLHRISTGWRPLRHRTPGTRGPVDERENAAAILEVFTDAGYSPALAFAAIVNAWAESALDNHARMSAPFSYRGKRYPNGSGAIGLFQLLPSKYGAGGPSGPEQGYRLTFEDDRWSGTAWQARHHGDTPDAQGRRYYDATDPHINTARILLELERDGARVLAADARGATIAELADRFGHDIERPQRSTHYRRQLAVDMLGPELALTRNPERLFAPPPPAPTPTCDQPEPTGPPSIEPAAPPQVLAATMAPTWTLLLTLPALLGVALLRPKRREDLRVTLRRP